MDQDNKFDFGSLGKVVVHKASEIEPYVDEAPIQTSNSLQVLSAAGVVLGSTVILTALNPSITRAGAIGVP